MRPCSCFQSGASMRQAWMRSPKTSGVSKATIYKHWQDKEALVLEVMGHLHGLDEEAPVFDSGDLRADLIAQLQYQPAVDRQALEGKDDAAHDCLCFPQPGDGSHVEIADC